MGAFILSLIVWLAQACLFGAATNGVIQNKGYDENWFWWGFFFGLIALLVALSKPEAYRYNVSRETESPLFRAAQGHTYRGTDSRGAGTWICGKCGRENQSYTGTCGCGRTKTENEKLLRRQEKERNELENAQKLKAYKDLLDAGAITQEEFDKKKTELLDL